MNMVNNVGLAIVACSGGWLAVQGLVTVGEIAAFVNYAGRLSFPLNQIAQLFTSIQSALAGAERIFELMDELPEKDAPNAQPLEHVKGDVTLNQVDFGYTADVPVLKKVSLHANEGQMIALVGPTGAGKTTIANLLTRFYDVDNGSILIDGLDVREVKKEDLRRKLGLVLQDNFLFADTVMENIRYGKLGGHRRRGYRSSKTCQCRYLYPPPAARLPDRADRARLEPEPGPATASGNCPGGAG